MDLQIKDFSKATEEWKRILQQEIEAAHSELVMATTDSQKHEAVHEARKHFKKIRAALRLVRSELKDYKKYNVFFRDLGREISDIRDANSQIEALDKLKAKYKNELEEDSFALLYQQLIQKRKEMASQHYKDPNMLAEIAKKLPPAQEEITDLKLKIQDFDQLKPNLKKVYKRGFEAFHRSANKGANKDFHEWRKRVKYLRYQIEILTQLWPAPLKTWEEELHTLTDLVGDNHDLLVLSQTVKKQKNAFPSQKEDKLFHSLLAKERSELQEKALLLGKKLYALEPGAFTAQIEACWR